MVSAIYFTLAQLGEPSNRRRIFEDVTQQFSNINRQGGFNPLDFIFGFLDGQLGYGNVLRIIVFYSLGVRIKFSSLILKLIFYYDIFRPLESYCFGHWCHYCQTHLRERKEENEMTCRYLHCWRTRNIFIKFWKEFMKASSDLVVSKLQINCKLVVSLSLIDYSCDQHLKTIGKV